MSDRCLEAGQASSGGSAFTGLKFIDGFSSQLIDPFYHLLFQSQPAGYEGRVLVRVSGGGIACVATVCMQHVMIAQCCYCTQGTNYA